jgi:putative transcriptional regulator
LREILRKERIKNKFTHKSIAIALGVSRCTYTNIELGRKNPSLTLAIKIKELLSYSDDNIFLNNVCLKGTINKVV